ncbi:hypothetical protein AXI76_gp080 [Pseudoalteromonas phage H101]|uniref:Uncharacterized protein n=1 Tax=Pseudoalteromonas phage H101 TaxID=1654919 RepID=A0A0H4ISY7_9CAUD|nr:hypothetical protein AXI76_gp080 [Pseudoalteromonas phage H101]AKO60981.1 hypothetical protein [Pseudoalteromonas phage H101]
MKSLNDYNNMTESQKRIVNEIKITKQALLTCQEKGQYPTWEWLWSQLEKETKQALIMGIKLN